MAASKYKYGWIDQYENLVQKNAASIAESGGEGNFKKDIDSLISDNKEAYDEMLEQGAIAPPTYEHSMGTNEGGNFDKVQGFANVDYSKLPKRPDAETPEGMTWFRSDDEFYQSNPDGSKYEGYQGKIYGTVEDSDWGTHKLTQATPKTRDAIDIIGPMIAMAVVSPMLAGLSAFVAPTLGISSTAGTQLLSAAFKAIPSFVMSEGENWEGLVAGLAGSAVGINTGSSLLGSAAKMGVNYGLQQIQKP